MSSIQQNPSALWYGGADLKLPSLRRVDMRHPFVGSPHMRFTIPTALIVGSLIVGTAWAQGSSSGGGSSGGGTGGSSGGAAQSTGSGNSTGPAKSANPSNAPLPRRGAQTPGNPGSNSGGASAPGRANTAPVAPPGSEGSTGGTAGSDAAATTGGISGSNRQTGQPSAVAPSSREEELLKEGERLEQRAKHGVCQGC
jgi:hypothetical protein